MIVETHHHNSYGDSSGDHAVSTDAVLIRIIPLVVLLQFNSFLLLVLLVFQVVLSVLKIQQPMHNALAT